VQVLLKDGSALDVPEGASAHQVAELIGPRLAKAAVAAKINGQVVDLSAAVPAGASLEIVTDASPEALEVFRHSLAHVMAQALTELMLAESHPATTIKPTIGPPIEHGFYYDFGLPRTLSAEDLPVIEERMRAILAADLVFTREEVSREEALRRYAPLQNEFKVELIRELPEGGPISFYRQERSGQGWWDLCRGPHVPSTARLPAHFKLTHVSGAYWRGDERQPMLQRVYGIAFATQQELEKHLWRLEEARKRDHRRVGRELGLYVFHDVSPGAPFWLPKGMWIFRELERLWREVHDAAGYQEINTPILVKKDVWERSGHWDYYQENMFNLEVEEQTFSLKPMNCPESTFVYRQDVRSYRDLPLRLSEIGRLHRNELSGALSGLFRVRQITMDDAHIFCRPDQIEKEITGVLKLVKEFYSIFELVPEFKFATRPEQRLGADELWDQAERGLERALKRNQLAYELKPGDGAFYGPKIDIHIEDALGRDWQMATIQLDYQLPLRFDLEYIDADGQAKRPVMIHRAIFGSFERFIGMLTEHYAGDFPFWLSPIQVRLVPIADRHVKYASRIARRLDRAGIRAEVDERSERMQAKVRDAELEKIPVVLVVGDREAEAGTVNVRERHVEGQRLAAASELIRELKARRRERR
jgi:threonyl-tRNA synthetase